MSGNSAARLGGGIVGAAVLGFASGGTLTAAGFAIGSAIGGSLVPPETETIKGPKLDDTSVQSDEVGTALPTVKGTQRVTAFREWIEGGGLRPETTTSGGGGGKGGGPPEPERESTQYYATFLAVLAENPPGKTYRLRRLWFDSVLIVDARGQEGRSNQEFVETILGGGAIVQGEAAGEVATVGSESDTVGSIVFMDGNESQRPPARMVADRGASPGYRGRAAVLVEDLAVKKYGQRVPKVSAELVEDATNELFQVVYTAKVDEKLGGPPLWIENGATVCNWGIINTDSFGNLGDPDGHQGGLERDYFDYTLDPLGNIVDTEVNDLPTLGSVGGGDDDLSSSNGVIYDVCIGYIRTLLPPSVPFGIAGATTLVTYFSGALDFNNLEQYVAATYQQSGFDNAFIVEIERDEGADRISLSMTPDRRFIFTWNSFSDGTVKYRRYDAKTFIYGPGALEEGEIKPSNELLKISSQIIAATSADAAHAMVESNLNRLWVVQSREVDYDNSTAQRNEIVVFIKNGSDYEEVARDVLDSGSLGGDGSRSVLQAGIADNGVARFLSIDRNRYTIVSLGTVAANTTTVGNIVSDLCDKAGLEPSEYDASQVTDTVRGYVYKQTTARSTIAQLRQLFPFDIRDSGYQIEFVPRGQSPVMTLTDDELQAREPGQETPPTVEITRSSEVDMPREVEIRYSDVDRRLEGNLQREARQSTRSEGSISVQAPIAFTSTEARRVADVVLKDSWQSQTELAADGSYRLLALEPADVVTFDTDVFQGDARIERIDDGDPGLRKFRLVPEGAGQYSSVAEGGSGSVGDEGIPLDGPTRALPMDLPALVEAHLGTGHVYALGGPLSGWPGGSLVEYRGNQTEVVASQTDSAVFGYTQTQMSDGPTEVFDRATVLRVVLASGTLESVTTDELLSGANTLAINTAGIDATSQGEWEIAQFRDAELVDTNTYDLSFWLRGRRGTERLTGTHNGSGARIVLLSGRAGLGFVTRETSSIDETRGYRGVTFGSVIQADPSRQFTYTGVNLTPLSPVAVRGSRNLSGDLTISWTRRTRAPRSFLGKELAPLQEASEQYEVDILDGSTVVRTITSTSESVTYTASEQQNDFGSVQSSVTVKIYQVSATVGRGFPAEETV
jgi:hypothetical protein